MASVDIPKWLKSLPLAPEFRPTDTEFADPIAYISKIEKEASAFGICKVIPPLPKPSKRYVLRNLNRSLSRSRELGYDANDATSDVPNAVAKEKTDVHDAKAVFTTRQQELGQVGKKSKDQDCIMQSAAQKQVWQSGEVYTLEQFESKSKAFSRRILGGIKDVTPQVIETLFWKANSGKPIYVEYANDVPGSGFGEPDRMLHYFHGRKRTSRQYTQSGMGKPSYVQQDLNTVTSLCNGAVLEALSQNSCSFSESGKEFVNSPMSSSTETFQSTKKSVSHANGELEGTAGWKLSNSPWNLQVIARSSGSLTRFLQDDIPGVTSPMVYIGMLFSWFAWHVEDHELHSLNFLHVGSPKTWYAVPGDYAVAFEETIRTYAYGGNVDHLAALKLIGEKTTLLSPELVVASGIPCCRLVQNPGEFVVTFPRAYHVGFSHGFNCGEAANFGTPQWLTVAKDAAVRRAAMDHLPMLSHQQLLYLLTMSFIPRIPRSLLPGVQCSRLKDRLKEERELLVKKAFLKDLLKENKLLNVLSRRYPTLRAVLWHPDLLPSAKESMRQPDLRIDSIHSRDGKLSGPGINYSTEYGLCHQLTSYVETWSDICNSGDLSCDFQVDSGALPCVACGILGYPLMCVIQPSMKATNEVYPAENLTRTGAGEILQNGKSCHLHCLTKKAMPATNFDETWNTSGFLRPQIFCLEHAVKIEGLLRPEGGANMLVICHTDYQKLKDNAVTVAEEMGTVFNYKEIPFDSASDKELSLIDIALDGEQFTDCQEDWTSKLGMNLRYNIKVRIGGPIKKMGVHNPDYLLSVVAPGSTISSIQWCCRKSRTKHESNYRKLVKSCQNIHLNKDETNYESGSNMKRREKILLKYSRRKRRAITKDSKAQCISHFAVECLPKESNNGEISAFEREVSSSSYIGNVDAGSGGLYSEQHVVQQEEVNVVEMCQKCATNISHNVTLDSECHFVTKDSEPPDTSLQVKSPTGDTLSCEITVLTKAFIVTSDNSVCQGETRLGKEEEKVNDNLHTHKPAFNMEAIEKPGSCWSNNIEGGTYSIADANMLMSMGSLEEPGNKQHIPGIKNSSDSACHSSDAEIKGSSIPEKVCSRFDVHDHATCNVPQIRCVNETYKYDTSTCMGSTYLEESTSTLLKNYKDGYKIRTWACSRQENSEQGVDRTIANAKLKRAREVTEAEIHNDFIRSPCEGLRPRIRKEDLICKSSSKMSPRTDQKPLRKMIKKSSGSSIACVEVMAGKGSHKCNLEGCKMCFRTKAELSLHRRNKCHYEQCGKRFRSHKYVVLHQRVHDDKRPLKCTWKGCSMTFKWAWARTEHLRLHTGERPYECKIEGCGRTFRFVSDFSRHRRKTGHKCA